MGHTRREVLLARWPSRVARVHAQPVFGSRGYTSGDPGCTCMRPVHVHIQVLPQTSFLRCVASPLHSFVTTTDFWNRELLEYVIT